MTMTPRSLTVNEGKVRCYTTAFPLHLHLSHLGFFPNENDLQVQEGQIAEMCGLQSGFRVCSIILEKGHQF